MERTDCQPLKPPARSQVEPNLGLDCRRYRGDRPCAAGVQGVCPADCGHYSPMGHRILVIKLAALGDVIRTAALLPGLKAAWPTSHITWVTRPNAVRMLANHPLIDRLLPFDADSLCHLECEQFDLCLSLDKEPAPAGLAMRVHAAERRGLGLSRYGTVFPLNPECGPYFRLGLDDDLKFNHNTASYQQLIYAAVGLDYAGQRYHLHPGPAHHRQAHRAWQQVGVRAGETVIGLNTGAGDVFANKTWPPDKFAQFAELLVRRHGWRVALLGGPREDEINRHIAEVCQGLTLPRAGRAVPAVLNVCADARRAGIGLDELGFVALLAGCSAVVTGDTMAVHVAIAMDVPCVVLFGPTCAQEIDVYDCGTKIVTTLPCAPCYRRTCDYSPNCMDDITLERVLTAVERWVRQPRSAPEQAVPLGV